VYLDVVFTINWVMDYLLLWATARFAQLSTSAWRLIVAATCGAIYALLPFTLNNQAVLGAGGRLGVSLLLVALAYRRLNLRRFCQAVFYLYLVAFAMAGAVLGAMYVFNARLDAYALLGGLVAFLSRLPYPWLLAAVAAALLLARWGAPWLRRSLLAGFFQVPMVIRWGEKRLAVRALVDTGNQLRDPITGRPVVIVEYDALRPLLPPSLRQAVEAGEEPDLGRLAEELRGTAWAARVHLVPFTSLGRPRGMLLCFRPDELVVITEDRMVRVREVLVGIYRQRLSPQGSYRALLHPDVLQAVLG
jgi:stage II sporulation protein GA (sporulation sigma-E factor processing peptidase)